MHMISFKWACPQSIHFVTKTMNFDTLCWWRFHTAHDKFHKDLPDSCSMHLRRCCVRFLCSNSQNFFLQLNLNFEKLDWSKWHKRKTRQFLRKPHSKWFAQFWSGFCWFWQGRSYFDGFRQNILDPARSCAFFMYTLFLLESKSSRRNPWFTVENVVENIAISVSGGWIKCFPLITITFSTVFSTVNSRFLLEDLLSSKKKCIHEKCARASLI